MSAVVEATRRETVLALIEAAGKLRVRGRGDEAARLCRLCWRQIDAIENNRECPTDPATVLARVKKLLG